MTQYTGLLSENLTHPIMGLWFGRETMDMCSLPMILISDLFWRQPGQIVRVYSRFAHRISLHRALDIWSLMLWISSNRNLMRGLL